MITSKEWWERVKRDPERLSRWLRSQYRGESLAGRRIAEMRDRYVRTEQADQILTTIAEQEHQHAAWIGELLDNRGIHRDPPQQAERYWPQAAKVIRDLETGCAAAAHAEAMRLERIQAIVDDVTGPWDIREVFLKILPQERFHERAFRELAGAEAMADTAANSALARAALGLAP